MRKVLASLKPYYYYLVGEGIKKIEVRKDMPKASDWDNEVLFYMSKDEKSFAKIPKEFQEKYRKHFGKVGMQFICDKVYMSFVGYMKNEPCYWDILNGSCLTKDEIMNYGKWKTLYGWHISDLKIYDSPKKLSEFYTKKKCNSCKKSGYESTACMYDEDCKVPMSITRAPQSWQYIEDLGEEE